MQKHSLNTKGFAPLALVLIVLVAAVLVGGGAYVYHQNRKAKPVSDVTSHTNTSSAQTTKSTTTPKQNYFAIKEWGVEAPYNGSQTFTYTISASNNGVGTATFNSTQLTQAAQVPSCTKDGGGGKILRAQAGTTIYGPGSQTLVQNLPNVKQVGNYYYWYEPNQDSESCGASTNSLQSQLQTDVNALLNNLQATS
jgi:uncharacterized protein (UPF0333 family)